LRHKKECNQECNQAGDVACVVSSGCEKIETIIKQNQEFKEMLLEQSKENRILQEKILNMHDLIIRNAQVFDGTGLPAVLADVAVSQGRIVQIGKVTGPAHESIDAQGLALMPGIVDLHTHYDAQVTWDRTLSPSPALGVTTAVIGNCGFGIAPCPAPLRETMLKNLSVVEGMDLQSLLTGVNWEFETFGQYMDQLRRIGPYVNTAVFAGHSVIRTSVMGAQGSTQAEPSPEQLQAMQNA
jgi:N-acyl-D-aspartate/D-glutamate deacylase